MVIRGGRAEAAAGGRREKRCKHCNDKAACGVVTWGMIGRVCRSRRAEVIEGQEAATREGAQNAIKRVVKS